MAALEWHSESREWYRAAVLVLGMMLASRAIVRNAVEGPLLAELNLDLLFLLIALPGFWLAVQGYRLRKGRGAIPLARFAVPLERSHQKSLCCSPCGSRAGAAGFPVAAPLSSAEKSVACRPPVRSARSSQPNTSVMRASDLASRPA